MRIIAIKDAPPLDDCSLTSSRWTNMLLREHSFQQPYKIGDIFQVSNSGSNFFNRHKVFSDIRSGKKLKYPEVHTTYVVIFNHHIGTYMEVNYDNFILLDEHRENQINHLLSE